MSVTRIPLSAQNIYADLLTRLREDSLLEVGGTPVMRERRGRHRDDAMCGRVGARASQRRVVSQAPRAPPAVGASARRWRAFPGDRASRRALAGRARDDASIARAKDSCGRGRRTHRASTS